MHFNNSKMSCKLMPIYNGLLLKRCGQLSLISVGYYFIDEMSGRFILLPTAPHLEGQLRPGNQDDSGDFILQGLIEATRQPVGEGFSAYRWYRPDNPDAMADKGHLKPLLSSDSTPRRLRLHTQPQG